MTAVDAALRARVVVRGLATYGVLCAAAPAPLAAQDATTGAAQTPAPPAQTPSTDDGVFRLGEIVYVLGQEPGSPGIGGTVIRQDAVRTFEKNSLDQAVNLAPGVVSTFDTFDANGRRNESDIFVRGFGRWQVPLMIDGVRIYLPADNRLDFSRFLTADIAAIQIQKGYASVLDGPGAMGGAINLVTMKPSAPFEAEGGLSAGGRGIEGWNAYAMVGSRRPRYYVQGGLALSDRESWSLSSRYQPSSDSLQGAGKRVGSDTRDWRVNVKVGYTPNATNEYALNYTTQSGEKGAPLNVYNNPPVPPNSYWRWPWWNVQTTALVTSTQLSPTSYLKRPGRITTPSRTRSTPSTTGRTRRSRLQGRRLPIERVRSASGILEEPACGVELLRPGDLVPVVTDAPDDIHRRREANGVLDGHGPRVLRLLLQGIGTAQRGMRGAAELLLGVHVRSIVKGRLERVYGDGRRAKFHRGPVGVIVVRTVEAPAPRSGFGVAVPNRVVRGRTRSRATRRSGRAAPPTSSWDGSSIPPGMSGWRQPSFTAVCGTDPDSRPAGYDHADPERRRRELCGHRAIGRVTRLPCAARGRELYVHASHDHRCIAAEPSFHRCPLEQGLSLRHLAPASSLRLTPNLELADDRWSDVNTVP